MLEATTQCDDVQAAPEAEEAQTSSKNQDDRKHKIERAGRIKESLENLKLLALAAIDQNRLAFIQNVLALSGQIKKIFFSNLLLTTENINRRYRELARQFHPDKAKWIAAAYQIDAHDLMVLISDCKDDLLHNLARACAASGERTFYQEQGDNFWKLAMDYRYASKGEWDKLTMLRPGALAHLSTDVLNKSRIENAIRAYEAYRACCRVADNNQYLPRQIQLRGHIALCLYAAGRHLEAQLYALAAVQLIFNKPQHVTQAELSKAKNILDKVQGRASARGDTQPTASEPTSASQALSKVGVGSSPLTTVQERSSFTNRIGIQSALADDLSKVAKALVLTSDRSLVKYQAAAEDILRAKIKAARYKTAGIATMAGAVVAGGGISLCAVASTVANVGLIQAGLATGAVLVLPIAGIFTGFAAIGLGIWGGKSLWEKGQNMLQEPAIREKLNEIMEQALQCYDQGKLQGFFSELTTAYDTNERLFSLAALEEEGVPVGSIIESLTKHGFRPDGIAYLFNLMGEALSSGKVSIPGCKPANLIDRAESSFKGSLRKSLEESAKRIDARISSKRKKDIANTIKNYANVLLDLFLLRDEGYLAREHVKDAQEMPFTVRLEEMRNVAKLNIAIVDIIRGEQAGINAAKQLVQEVRNSIDHYGQFHTIPGMRLAAIEDFLWIVSGQPADGEYLTSAIAIAANQPLAEEADDDRSLGYLNNELQKASSSQKKAKIYNQRAAQYAKKAQEEAKVDHLGSLQHWQKAQKDYVSALKLINHDETASLGYARCLIGLSKYDQALNCLNNNPSLLENSDAWIMTSVAHRKQLHYQQAKGGILEALARDPKSQEAGRQKALIEKLQARPREQRLNEYSSTQICCEELYFDARRSNEKQYYTILSIDGGGVRGVLPALWLSEIEHRTKRPIAHLFNMVAGTSTGAIIAAGLSVPYIDVPKVRRASQVVQKEVLSPYRPRYSASEIVELYRQKSTKIFTRSEWSWMPGYNWVGDKYKNTGLSSIFREQLGQTTLGQALTELVIPAVSKDNFTRTHLFSRYESQKDPVNNATLYDVLMATTAAPTFFPAYKIENKGTFVDGAVQANNPAMEAYSAAGRYGLPRSEQEIFMLSMGAGTCIPDPLKAELYSGKLFWASNYPRVNLALQEGDTDRQMRSNLGDRYQRWQVWLERPIGLDAYQAMGKLLELGQQHLEELYASDDNTMNKLLEFLEDQAPPA